MGSIIFTNFTVIFHMAPHSVDPGDEDRPYTTHQLQDQVDKSTADSLAGGISCANYNLKSLQVEDCPIDETSRLRCDRCRSRHWWNHCWDIVTPESPRYRIDNPRATLRCGKRSLN